MQKLAERFIEFEKQEKLFSIKIKAHYVWNYVRCIVFEHYIKSQRLHFKLKRKKRNLKNLVQECLISLWILISYSLSKKKCYDIIIMCRGIKYANIENKKVDPITHPILISLSKKYRLLFIDPAEINENITSHYPCDILRFRPFYLWDRFKAKILCYSKKDKLHLKNIFEKCKNRFDSDIDTDFLIKNFYSTQLCQYKTYIKILSNHKPRAVMFINDHHVNCLVEACKKLNLPSIELQHSSVTPLNIAYNYGKDEHNNDLPITPDYIFSFGNYWNSAFSAHLQVVPVGFPYFDTFSPDNKEGNNPDKKTNIIVLSTLRSKKTLVEFVLKLSDLLPKHTIFYKLRPTEYGNWRSDYPPAFSTKNNLKVIDSYHPTLYEYFRNCNYQLGSNSTTIYEGIAFNLTTFILADSQNHWDEEDEILIEKEYAFAVSNAEEMAELIVNGKTPRNTLPREQLFRANAIENIKNEINNILGHRGTEWVN